MSLREYKRKRHFNRTPEPAAKKAGLGGRSFVIQKHAASHLHYDFRLELDGVLKSWAVPKGPSLDPTVKRLAMHVEDHPVTYGAFEGVIPQGEYGGGTVMLWDRGTWEPAGDAREDYRNGRLKFILHGEKLRGRWMLVRTSRTSSPAGEQRQWLLFKERDDEARPASEGDVLEELPLSVSTKRSLEEIANDKDWVWNSKPKSNGKHTRAKPGPDNNKSPKVSAAVQRRVRASLSKLVGAKAGAMPRRVEVQLATLAKEAPHGDEWFHEIKFDGYRMICRIDDGHAEFITRNHKDWTARLTSLAEAAKRLPVTQAILDGEVVALRPDGTTDFQELQNAFRDRRSDSLYYYVFDLLYLAGYDLTAVTLEERKRILAELLAGQTQHVRLSEHIAGKGPEFINQACKTGLEGIIAKRRDKPYAPGRGYDWVKVKCMQTGEFVIGGYTDPTGSREGFGALLTGYHNSAGELVYAGKVGTGFDDRTLRLLLERLKALSRTDSPFANLKRGKAHWVEPTLVAQVTFGSWTRDGLLRHPSFQGLREDKAAAEVTREKPVPVEEAERKAAKPKPSRRGASPSRSKREATHAVTDEQTTVNDYDARKQQLAGVRLTSPDKVLYPEQNITKLELANYYRAAADWILPHIADRPLVFVRCPEGRGKECFYQKHPTVGSPDAFRLVPVRESKKTEDYVIVDDVAGLISIAQIGALEIHVWGSRADKLEQPDRLIFDLDPDPKVPWSRVVQSAQQVRQFLKDLGLESFLKTTGGKGLHLVVPIERRYDWEEVKAFCKSVADVIVSAAPQHYTANMAKAARSGKIFLDYLRNGRGATAIAPYSTRSRPGAPISVPISWKELTARLTSDHYTVRNIGKRLGSLKKDPWEGIASVRQGLTGPMEKLRQLAR